MAKILGQQEFGNCWASWSLKFLPAFSLPDSLALPFDRSAVPSMAGLHIGREGDRPPGGPHLAHEQQWQPKEDLQMFPKHVHVWPLIWSHTLYTWRKWDLRYMIWPESLPLMTQGSNHIPPKPWFFPEFLTVYPHNRRLSITHGDAKRPVRVEKLMGFLHFGEECVSFRPNPATDITHPAWTGGKEAKSQPSSLSLSHWEGQGDQGRKTQLASSIDITATFILGDIFLGQ